MPPVIDHECSLVGYINEQEKQIDKLRRENEQLKKALIGPKSERSKLPRVERAIGAPAISAEARQATRSKRAKAKEQLRTVKVEHKVPAEKRSCPQCGNAKLDALGEGRTTVVYEYIPAEVVRVEHVQEVLRCRCGGHIVTAPGAPKVIEQGHYGASLLSHLVVAKCVDSIPIYRLEKEFQRQEIPIARSTLNELFHRAADVLSPVSRRLLELIRTRDLVQADETRMRLLDGGDGKPRNGFIWTFLAADANGQHDIAYRFTADRSGETPRNVLGGTAGTLLVDAYSGYNSVSNVSTRERAGCHAHLRRYFHESLPTAPAAQEAIDQILDLYRVEHEAKELGIVRSAEHLALRREKSTPVRGRLKLWLDTQAALHPPKSPIGTAIRYGLNHWDALGRFLDDSRIPLDNNASERALRRVALGRKNFLFVADVSSGENIAGLYSVVATCEARGINPFEYLVDVIARIGDHPANKLDELLPAAWAAARP